jgi:pimeloyl-ACP methyl ester carboxylesterase
MAVTALVILPGLDGTGTLHGRFVAACGAFACATIIEYPPDRALGYRELEALVRSELPTTDRFVLLGESFSGPVAIAIAADPPPNMVGLVLSTTFARRPMPALSPLAHLVRLAPVHRVPRSLLAWWLLGRWTDAELERSLQAALRGVAPAVLQFRAMAALRARGAGRVAVKVPALYLRGTHDRLLPASAGEHIRAQVPGCRLVDIAGPHLLLQAAPDDCARVVDAFVRGLGAGVDP